MIKYVPGFTKLQYLYIEESLSQHINDVKKELACSLKFPHDAKLVNIVLGHVKVIIFLSEEIGRVELSGNAYLLQIILEKVEKAEFSTSEDQDIITHNVNKIESIADAMGLKIESDEMGMKMDNKLEGEVNKNTGTTIRNLAKESDLIKAGDPKAIFRELSKQPYVLIVDDDKDLLSYYNIALSIEGFNVKTLNNPMKIMETLKYFKPDVIILDYDMPDFKGNELADLLKLNPQYMDIPIIFITASPDALKRKFNQLTVGNDVIEKPADEKRLSSVIKKRIFSEKEITDICTYENQNSSAVKVG